MEIGKRASTTEGETAGSGRSSHYGSHGEKEIYDFTRKAFPAWRTHASYPFLVARSMPLNGLTPWCLSASWYARRTPTHAKTKQPARCDRGARGCCTRPGLNVSRLYSDARVFSTRPLSVPARCARLERDRKRDRKRECTAARFPVPFFVRRWKWRLERDTPREQPIVSFVFLCRARDPASLLFVVYVGDMNDRYDKLGYSWIFVRFGE